MQIETSSTLSSVRKITYEDLSSEITKFDFIKSLMEIQRFGVYLANQTGVNVKLQFEFHVSPKVEHSILIPSFFIPFIAKQIILKCKSSEIGFNELDLVNLSYMYNNLETDLMHTTSSDPNKWKWILRSVNNQWHHKRLPSAIIGRYVSIYEKIFQNDALKEKINDILPLDFDDILKIGTCIYANYCWRTEGCATSFEMKNYTETTMEEVKDLLTEENIEKFFEIFAINQEGFIAMCNDYNIDNDLLKTYEFNPLRRYPVIKTESVENIEKYIIPSLPDFTYAIFEGMYYVLIDSLDQPDKDALFQACGKAFEGYIGDLIQFYKLDTLSGGNLLPEQTYTTSNGEVKSADWIIVTDDVIYQIECKKRKLNTYAKACIDTEDGQGISSIINSIAEEVDKFSSKEQHIKDGLVDTIEYNNQSFVNIIVYLDEMFGVNEYAKEHIKSKMTNPRDNFTIMGSHDFELLCQHSKDKTIDINQALLDISKHDTKVFTIDYLDEIYNGFYDGILNK